MVGAMRQIRITKQSLLTNICLLSMTFVQANNIFKRTTCPESTYKQCGNAGLPSDFCCPATSTCISLAQNTTLLCCPAGSNCATIQPITCDITQQNITAHPENTLKTTALSGTLKKCGSNCCPFGYTCINGNCQMKADQADSVPGQLSSVVSSTSLSSTTNSGTKATATSSSLSSSTNPTSTPAVTSTSTPITIIPKTCDKFPIDAILVGLLPGIALGIILTLLGLCCIGRRKESHRKSGSSFGNISDPVPTSDIRTDFLRKIPQTPSSSASETPRRRNTITRVRSLFRKSTAPGITNNKPHLPYQSSPGPVPPIPLNIQRQKQPAAPEGRPITPPLQREPSFEDINIFTDADTASSFRAARDQQHQQQYQQNSNHLGVPPAFGQERGSHQTTFTDMMERSGLAGLQKGQRTYQLLHDNLSKQEGWKDKER